MKRLTRGGESLEAPAIKRADLEVRRVHPLETSDVDGNDLVDDRKWADTTSWGRIDVCICRS